MATKHGKTEDHAPGIHHEVTDVSAGPITYFALGLVVLLLATLVSVKGLFSLLDQEASRSDPQLSGVATERPKLPPLPRLEVDPVSVRTQVLQSEKSYLESYGWIDQKQGIARVPIQRAMELLASRASSMTERIDTKRISVSVPKVEGVTVGNALQGIKAKNP
ncbi:MAG: hypothetical protein U0V70_01030 [Terriglobia bacterium]